MNRELSKETSPMEERWERALRRGIIILCVIWGGVIEMILGQIGKRKTDEMVKTILKSVKYVLPFSFISGTISKEWVIISYKHASNMFKCKHAGHT